MNPLETLQETSNHFEVTYTNFKDHKRQIWTVKVISEQPPLSGEGESLDEALHDLNRQRELAVFKNALQHTGLGKPTLEEWKGKIREIL